MDPTTAKAIATIAIWTAVAVTGWKSGPCGIIMAFIAGMTTTGFWG